MGSRRTPSIAQNDSLRLSGEEALVRELIARGLQSVATYRIAPKEERKSGCSPTCCAGGRPAADLRTILARQDELRRKALAAAGRIDPCPCGSGRKFKRCHGDVTAVHQPWKNPPSNQSHSR